MGTNEVIENKELLDVNSSIDKLKKMTSTYSDRELASALGLSKNSVGNWRTRNAIPTKYKKMAEDSFVPPIAEKELIAKITFYDIEASAGHGALVESEEPQLVNFSERYLADEFNVKPSEVFLIRCSGDSMHPTVKDGTLMVVKRINELGGDGVYVFRVSGQIMVKRLQFQPMKIIFISDNEDLYEPWELSHKEIESIDFEIIGRVILGCGRI